MRTLKNKRKRYLKVWRQLVREKGGWVQRRKEWRRLGGKTKGKQGTYAKKEVNSIGKKDNTLGKSKEWNSRCYQGRKIGRRVEKNSKKKRR